MAVQRSTNNIDIPNRRDAAWGLVPGGYNGQLDEFTPIAGATVNAYRAVKPGASAGFVIQGAAAADALIGVNQSPQAALVNQPIMLAVTGVGKIEVGATPVAAGDFLTTDTVGRAVPSVTATDRVVGYALEAGAAAAIIRLVIVPHFHG